jgi:hypothetical protein
MNDGGSYCYRSNYGSGYARRYGRSGDGLVLDDVIDVIRIIRFEPFIGVMQPGTINDVLRPIDVIVSMT